MHDTCIPFLTTQHSPLWSLTSDTTGNGPARWSNVTSLLLTAYRNLLTLHLIDDRLASQQLVIIWTGKLVLPNIWFDLIAAVSLGSLYVLQGIRTMRYKFDRWRSQLIYGNSPRGPACILSCPLVSNHLSTFIRHPCPFHWLIIGIIALHDMWRATWKV